MTGPDVVVVGSGVAGLTAARDLARAGLSVILLEASDSTGGKLRSHEVDGLALDAGAESFATRGGVVEGLVRELGMVELLVTPAQGGAWLRTAKGRSFPLPRSGLLGVPGLPMAADVRRVVGFGGALRAQLDSVLPGFVGAGAHTVGALVRRRMGSRVLERLVTPVVTGVHSRNPDDLELDSAIPGLRPAMRRTGTLARAVLSMRSASPAGSNVAGLVGGVHQLATALEAEVLAAGVQLRLSSAVREVAPDHVVTKCGERIATRHVVLACTLQDSSAVGPGIALATLVVDSAELDSAPRGTGVLVAPGPSAPAAKALTHATAKWAWLGEAAGPRRHVLRISYGGEAAAQPRRQMLEQARVDAASLLGVGLPPSAVRGATMAYWHAAPSRSERIPAGVHLIGEAVSGVGLASVIGQARRAAGSIISKHTAGDVGREDD